MKKIIITLGLGLLLIIACRDQQPVTQVKSDIVRFNTANYKLNRPNDKVMIIFNSLNKLTNTVGIAPNVPNGIIMKQYMIADKSIITKICAEVIPLATLIKLPKGNGDWLSLNRKINPQGKPIEMTFLIKNTSLISAKEFQQIEKRILTSSSIVTFKLEVQKFLKGINYLEYDATTKYNDILKAKQDLN